MCEHLVSMAALFINTPLLLSYRPYLSRGRSSCPSDVMAVADNVVYSLIDAVVDIKALRMAFPLIASSMDVFVI